MKPIQSRAGGEVVATTLRLPRDLITEVKIQALRAGRSFNTHLVMILKEAAGAEFGDAPPAAGTDRKANHRGAHDHAGE